MKIVTCDFCLGENNKDVGFEYQMFSEKFPLYSSFAIFWVKVDICAKCYADIFKIPVIQEKIAIIFHRDAKSRGKPIS